MTSKQDNKGRRQGSRTKGNFFRTGRGWCAKAKGKFYPLTNEAGERLKDQDSRALHSLHQGDEIAFHENHILAIHGIHRQDIVLGMDTADLTELAQWLASQ